ASPRWRRLGIEAEALVMPTAYAAIDAVLAPALAGGFDAVLMIGVAGRARRVRVERRAANRASLLSPDVERRRRTAPALAPGASHRISRAGATAALARLRRAGIPCRLSRDAGRYLCNASYFAALAAPMPGAVPAHPRPPRQRPRRPGAKPARLGWHERLAEAFVDVAVDLLGAARHGAARRDS
ncbi:MAG: peptidase C15, partial [Microvirga sp.]